MTATQTRVLVYSDFVCPYCYVRQARAGQLQQDYDVEVEWLAYALDATTPPEGKDVPIPPERLAAAQANVRRMIEAAGLPIGEFPRMYNSLLAHEAATWAHDQHPAQEEAFRRAIFQANFVHNQNIGQPEVLVRIAEQCGLSGDALRLVLASRQYQTAVEEQMTEARDFSVTGVPTYVAGRYALVGAQPYEVFHRLMAAVNQPRREAATG